MYQASEGFRAAVAGNGRTFELDLRKDGRSIDASVMAMSYTGGTLGGDTFCLGGTVCNYIELTLRLPAPVLAKAEISVYIRPKANPEVEWVPLGLFTCDRPEIDGEEANITGYDRMIKLERAYFSGLTYPATSNQMLQEISTACGVPVILPQIAVTFEEALQGYTCRETVSFIAQRIGCFATIDRAGNLCFKQYADNGQSIPFGRYWDPFERAEADYELSGIKCATGTTESESGEAVTTWLTVGDETKQVITMENPFMTQADLDGVWTVIHGLVFRPGKVEAMGDPAVDPGDILTVYDGSGTGYKVPVTSLDFDFDVGLSMAVEAAGAPESDQDVNIKGAVGRQMDRLSAQLFLAEKVIARKIDADEVAANYVTAAVFNGQVANINTLNADYASFKTATANRLTAAEGKINTLETTTLTAITARIGTLEAGVFSAIDANIGDLSADVAAIQSLLAGTAAATTAEMIHLNAQNAVIDSAMLRTALIGVLTVADLSAGHINTDEVSIGSEDGSLDLDGSLIQFKDENETVRIQIGKDANGDFTFVLYDENGTGQLINANGIQPSAVSDGLIVNRMVANNAAIDGSKLNIQSVASALSEDGTLSVDSSQVTINDTTLSAAYQSLVSRVGATESSTSTLETGLQVVQGQITSKVWQSDIDTATSPLSASIETALRQSAELIIGTQTEATGSWTGVSSTITELYDGLQIVYWLPYAGSGSASLTLTLADQTTTDAVPVYYRGSTRANTHFVAGTAIHLTYRINAVVNGTQYTGWWADASYDSGNTYNRTRYDSAIKAASAITSGYIICGTSAGYIHVAAGSAFDLSYPLLYARSAIASGKTGTNNDTHASNINFTTTAAVEGAGANKLVYLKGSASGKVFTADQTHPLTTAEPSSEDGKYYIPLGVMSSATNGTFVSSNRLYAYIDGKFQAVDTAAKDIASEARAATVTQGASITTLTERYATQQQTIDGFTTQIGNIQTTLETKADGSTVQSLTSRVNNVEETASGFSRTITAMQAEINSTVTGVAVYYALNNSQTTAPDDDDPGWSLEAPAWIDGMYMWQKTVTTYSSGDTSTSEPTCLTGASGSTGEDAVLLRIDSSRGTVFKNNAVSTVLSVAIYKGSERITTASQLRSVFGNGARLEWEWLRLDDERYGVISASDTRLSDGGFQFALGTDDVDVKVTFRCSLII